MQTLSFLPLADGHAHPEKGLDVGPFFFFFSWLNEPTNYNLEMWFLLETQIYLTDNHVWSTLYKTLEGCHIYHEVLFELITSI